MMIPHNEEKKDCYYSDHIADPRDHDHDDIHRWTELDDPVTA